MPNSTTASRSTGRNRKPSQKVLENSRLDAELQTSQVAPTTDSQAATTTKESQATTSTEEPQAIKDEPLPIDEPLPEGHYKPIKTTSKGSLKRRSLPEVMADIPPIESVIFEPLNTGPDREPQLRLPSDININDPYALFSLFWPENMWQIISRNTNLYAIKQRLGRVQSEFMRPWFDTSAIEIKVFIAILIYMGIHDSKRTDFYWRNDISSGPIHTPQLYMSLNRFEQIKRYLHISQPLGENTDEPQLEATTQYSDEYMKELWWRKVLPLADVFRNACQQYYIPGTHTAIDELMIRCFGRSLHTYKMPNKPINQGYKLFALAEHGYIWWFIWSSRKHSFSTDIVIRPDLTPTGSMVYHLVKRLPVHSRVYLDNYFTSIPLFRLLRKEGYGLCGTTRPHSGGSEFPTLLKEIKQFHATSLPYHQIIAITVPDVLCLGWQDNNIVLALSTIHTVHTAQDLVEKERRRPTKTSTNGSTTWKAFGDNSRMTMPIPRLIDDYNQHMGGVDIANQFREPYETHRTTLRVWFPLFYWLIDAAVINAYRLQYLYKKRQGVPTKELPSQIRFREALYKRLFSFQGLSVKRSFSESLPAVRMNTTVQHTIVRRPTRTGCIWCRHINGQRRKRHTADVLNGVVHTSNDEDGKRSRQTIYGCEICNVALCTKGPCWDEYHGGGS